MSKKTSAHRTFSLPLELEAEMERRMEEIGLKDKLSAYLQTLVRDDVVRRGNRVITEVPVPVVAPKSRKTSRKK